MGKIADTSGRKVSLKYYLDLSWDYRINSDRFDAQILPADKWIEENTKGLSDEEKEILQRHIESKKTSIAY